MDVELRAVTADDLVDLRPARREDDPFGWFGFRATNAMDKQFAEDGLIGRRFGILMITVDAVSVGYVGWAVVQYGPAETAQALNVGVYVFPGDRGRGIASAAQSALVDDLFASTLFERIEACTDVENVAEQRALLRAGFTREGVVRHGQFRDGTWHDLVLYSVLRGERAPAAPTP